jgi:hypothetical protein
MIAKSTTNTPTTKASVLKALWSKVLKINPIAIKPTNAAARTTKIVNKIILFPPFYFIIITSTLLILKAEEFTLFCLAVAFTFAAGKFDTLGVDNLLLHNHITLSNSLHYVKRLRARLVLL